MARNEFAETLYDSYGQHFAIDEVYFESRTGHQHLLIFHNAKFGRVMALDGVVQTTERDEFYYHEMMAHVPLFAHGQARRVLIIGGGDGGLLREVVKHRSVEHITKVEIDAAVVDMAKTWFPDHSQGAFDDPRFKLVIADGAEFVRTAEDAFDVIMIDSTDPIGPGEVLFTNDFYRQCKRILAPGGIMVTQNGVPFMQLDEARKTARAFRDLFADWHFYGVAVPTYIGGMMTLGWATENAGLRGQPLAIIEERFRRAAIDTRYYTPAIHCGAFALPRFVEEAIGK
ncbi:MAG: polyamine aminopropyltransferase [Gammaproteobacteria bacterium]|nr:polyamine aminopropyltransferase [Gammaproteobacteria bacterium]